MTAFNREVFGGTAIYRPTLEAELAVRQEAEATLRKEFKAGTYTKKDEINAILKRHFSFYDEMLKRAIPQIASLAVMDFVLGQYDLSFEINSKYDKAQVFDLSEREKWRRLGPDFRRAAKYLAECITMLAPTSPLSVEPEQVVGMIDRCWICAEQMVHLSTLSTQTFTLFPDETRLEIRPEGELEWFILSLTEPKRYEAYGERVRRDTASRKEVIDELAMVYNRQRLKDVLDGPFKANCGFTMSDVFGFAFGLNKNTEQPRPGFDVPFVAEAQILDSIRSVIGGTADEAKRMFDGLVLRPTALVNEGRVVWKPKQEYRAYTRPFFEFPHPTGTHFIWSRSMANECLMMLYTRLVQKHIPSEWEIGSVPKALEDYASAITKEFETTVNACLGQHGITTGRFKSSIGQGSAMLKIPDLIGELDVLGYWEKEGLLVVGECKLVKPTHEPATFRDDIAKFTGGSDNYVTQVKRKTKWAVENARQVAAALQTVKGFPPTVSVRRVAPILVTYYPAFASLFIPDVPCVALTELVADIRRHDAWPYNPTHEVDVGKRSSPEEEVPNG